MTFNKSYLSDAAILAMLQHLGPRYISKLIGKKSADQRAMIGARLVITSKPNHKFAV